MPPHYDQPWNSCLIIFHCVTLCFQFITNFPVLSCIWLDFYCWIYFIFFSSLQIDHFLSILFVATIGFLFFNFKKYKFNQYVFLCVSRGSKGKQWYCQIKIMWRRLTHQGLFTKMRWVRGFTLEGTGTWVKQQWVSLFLVSKQRKEREVIGTWNHSASFSLIPAVTLLKDMVILSKPTRREQGEYIYLTSLPTLSLIFCQDSQLMELNKKPKGWESGWCNIFRSAFLGRGWI